MKIGIDARFYGSLGKGLGRYVAELISALERLDDANEYVVFLRRANFDAYEPKSPRFTKELAEFPWYGWKEQLLYPLFLRRFHLDLMHFPHFNVPFFYRRPFVVTVHDLIMLRFPTPRATTLGPLRFRIKFFLYRIILGRAIADARTVITVSEWSKRDIEHHFPKAKNKTVVTLEAVSKNLTACHPREGGDPEKKQKEKTSTDTSPFALYVGNAYPHKNLDRLIEAFALFRRTLPDFRLVLVGAPDYFYARLRKDAVEKGWSENVDFFGHASDAELADLYDRAALYVFPSLHEGFGLPPLEAMGHGLPVAASNATCLPEILGDAAEWFDPKDPADIANAMQLLATNDARRAELIAKGDEQVKRYDWNDCGKRTLDIYHSTTEQHA